MGLKEEIDSLTIQEKKILSELGEIGEKTKVEKVQGETKLSQSAIMRASLGLEDKNFLDILEETEELFQITEEGKKYLETDLPERKILELISDSDSISLEKVMKKLDLSEEKIGIFIGLVKRKGWAEIKKDNGKELEITEKGQEALESRGNDELLLEKFEQKEEVFSSELSEELAEEISTLEGRGLITVDERTNRALVLTDKGEEAAGLDLEIEEKVSKLSSDLLTSGKWREVNLRDRKSVV